MLYGANGRPEFFSVVEVRSMLVAYDFFNAERAKFLKEPVRYSYPLLQDLLNDIHAMQRIPIELRRLLPEHFKLSNTDLSELEDRCLQCILPLPAR